MSKSPWLVVALSCSLAALPTISQAQASETPKAEAKEVKEEAQDFVHDVLRALLGPNWNLFAHGGVATGDRYLLQQAANPVFGQRSLQSKTGFDVGGGAGVDILLRTGVRVSYTFASRDLKFKTNDGNGSDALDINDVGKLKSHTVALEVMRYMLPSSAAVTPYGTLGLQGTWWKLDDNSLLVTNDGAKTPFSISPMFAFGVQVKASSHWSGRVEAALASGHNPFTGNRSFRAFTGPTIDEPSNVERTDFRLAGVYHFGRPSLSDLRNKVAKR